MSHCMNSKTNKNCWFFRETYTECQYGCAPYYANCNLYNKSIPFTLKEKDDISPNVIEAPSFCGRGYIKDFDDFIDKVKKEIQK